MVSIYHVKIDSHWHCEICPLEANADERWLILHCSNANGHVLVRVFVIKLLYMCACKSVSINECIERLQ